MRDPWTTTKPWGGSLGHVSEVHARTRMGSQYCAYARYRRHARFGISRRSKRFAHASLSIQRSRMRSIRILPHRRDPVVALRASISFSISFAFSDLFVSVFIRYPRQERVFEQILGFRKRRIVDLHDRNFFSFLSLGFLVGLILSKRKDDRLF